MRLGKDLEFWTHGLPLEDDINNKTGLEKVNPSPKHSYSLPTKEGSRGEDEGEGDTFSTLHAMGWIMDLQKYVKFTIIKSDMSRREDLS